MTDSPSYARIACAANGLYYALAGLTLFFAPGAFFARIAPIGPYNEHYMVDLGSFLLPLGLALLFAARDPVANRLLVALGAFGSVLHAISHLRDGIESARDIAAAGSLIVIAGLLVCALPLRRGRFQ